MKFSLPSEKEKYNFYVDKYREVEGVVELKKVSPPRTNRQNRYLHALIKKFGIDTGYTFEESKEILKKQCQFMRYEKDGHLFGRKSSLLDAKEMTDWINWIRNHASIEHGIYLPSSEDYYRNWAQIEREIELNKEFL